MAVDNWFQNWHHPFFLQPLHEPIKNYTIDHNYPAEHHPVRKTTSSNTFLPLLLSLNLLKPPTNRSDTFFRPIPPKKEKYHHRSSYKIPYNLPQNKQDEHFHENEGSSFDSETPFENSGNGNQKETYASKDEDIFSNSGPLKVPKFSNQLVKYSKDSPHPGFRIPLLYPGIINSKEKSFEKPYTNTLGFPDPFDENLRSKSNSGNITYEEEHNLKPLELTGTFKTWYRWKTLDFKYPSEFERTEAIASGDFVPENNLPLGIEVYKNRIFLSMPKWKGGVPVTLAQLPRVPKEESPQLVPYPNWGWHSEKSCDLITSVFRMYVDECGRLWVLDSGKISITTEEAKQHCPPKLLIFDLETDQLLDKFVFPKEFIKEDSLYSNVVVDIREGDCHDAYAYLADVWRFGIVVFRLLDHKAWRVTDHLFFPDPLASAYQLHHLKFEWTDGIFGIALGPVDHYSNDRVLYFHPMSSFREFYVKTSYLRDENGEDNKRDAFKVLGQSRGPSGHVSSSVMDDNGILFYNLVTRDSIGCWDSRKPYKRENLGVIAKSKETLVFPNDMRLDKEKRQSMWIVTNRLPYYLVEGLDVSRVNFRVMSAYTDESIKGTICDPDFHRQYTYVEYNDGVDCY